MKNFKINEFGEIIRDKYAATIVVADEDKLLEEYHKLEYEIFSHDDKSPEKLARFNVLKKQLGMDKEINVFAAAKAKMLEKKNNAQTVDLMASKERE